MVKKNGFVLQSITFGSGLLSFVDIDMFIDGYIALLTIICGTASIVNLIKQIIKRYKK